MLEEMIAFFKLAKEAIEDAHFLIFTLSDHGTVMDTIEKSRADIRDFTLMRIAPDKICDYVPAGKASLIFIKPVFSKTASCPTKFAEALACGMPVIINSGIGDTAEVIKKERVGVVIEDFSENGYRKGIAELTRLLQEGEVLRERCRDTARKYFLLEDGAGKYLQIYKDILAPHNRTL
jgi:glycosyltransferase involved in cell wall biosynthesis